MTKLTLGEALAILADVKPVEPTSHLAQALQRKASAHARFVEAEYALAAARAELRQAERELRNAADAIQRR